MKCLFGVQKGYNATFSMNLQFTDLDTNPDMKEFFDFIQQTDATVMKYLELMIQIIFHKSNMTKKANTNPICW